MSYAANMLQRHMEYGFHALKATSSIDQTSELLSEI